MQELRTKIYGGSNLQARGYWSAVKYWLSYGWFYFVESIFNWRWWSMSTIERHQSFVESKTRQFNNTGLPNVVWDANGNQSVESDRMSNGGHPPQLRWFLILLLLIIVYPRIKKYL